MKFWLLCAFAWQGWAEMAIEPKQSVAVAVIAYNRPHYLKQLLESLEKNPESQTLPFFFFLDGGPKSTQAANQELIQNSSIQHKQVIQREMNYGCPKNHIDAKRFVFDQCGFETVIFMEEDVQVSKNYISTLLRLHNWATQTYANVGTVQLWRAGCPLSRDEKRIRLNQVKEVRPAFSLVTYAMDRAVWKAISPFLYEWEQLFIDPLLGNDQMARARSKPSEGPYVEQMTRWRDHFILFGRDDRESFLRSLCRPFANKEILRPHRFPKKIYFNQDYMTAFALTHAGYIRLQTVVNRVVHTGLIGLSGGHADEKILTLDEFPEDETLTDFVYVSRPAQFLKRLWLSFFSQPWNKIF